MNIPDIAGKIVGGAKKVVKTIVMLPIIIKIVSILIIGFGFATLLAKGWEILTGENTPKKVYEELEVEDISEIVEIKENSDGEYYLDFADDADEKLDNLIKSLKGNGPYRSVPEDLLKKMFKAEIVTQFPDLGGKVPEDSTGFQGTIDIKRVTPNKAVGEVKNTGQGETSTIEQEQSEEAPLTLEEKEIKTWQKGKKLELNSNATVYEQLSSELELPGTEQKETGYWQEKIKEGTLNQEVIIKKSAEVEYNGNYRVNTSKLTGSTIIYVEVKAKQDGEEITGYIKSGKIAVEDEKQQENSEDTESSEEASIEQSKVASSRAGEDGREEKETIGEKGQQFTVAIAAGHSTVNPGASANGLVEQELTIQVAEKVQELIEEKYENIKVVQTGTTADNKDLDNKYRVQLAKDANPDLCIQIHFNAGGGTGVEALYKEGDGVSRQLAEIISETMASSMGIENRNAGTDIEKHGESLGIIASFADTGFPSVVTEGGFLDNTNDANLLKSDGLDKYAEGIVNGIVKYLEADHSGYTATKTGDSTVTKSVESKIYNMKYIKLEDLKAMEGSGKTANDVAEAIKYFSLDENNKLITLSWSLAEDGNITISENPAKDLKTDLQKYTMPFEYLLMFYIDADYEDFVSELADIVLNSEIVITLQDRITTTETTLHTYERRIANSPGEGTNYEKELDSQYSKSETCSTSIDLTYVDVWCVKAYQTNSYSEAVLNMGEQDEIVANIAGSVTETSNGGDYTEWSTTQGATVDYVTDSATGKQESYTYIIQQRTRTDIHTITNSFDKGEKKLEEQTDKFVDLYVKHSMNRRIREGWLFTILEKNEKTANLLDLTKYLMYLATNINYGVVEYDFSEYGLQTFENVAGASGQISLTTPVLSRELFIQAMEAYATKSGNQAFKTNFLPYAGMIYDVSLESGVNPELVVVTAKVEQNFRAGGGSYNYWGISVHNGSSSGSSFSSFEEGIRGYASVIQECMPGGRNEALILSRYEERKDSGCDPNGYGQPGTFSGMQSAYSWLGKHGQAYSGPSDGGYYYMDPSVAGVTKIYSTHEEFVQKCLNGGPEHAAGTDTTPYEQGQYTAWQVEKKIEVWNDIFGDYGSLSGAGGSATPATGDGYFQTYTSSTGRTYKEYKQTRGSYANKIFEWAGGTIYHFGCSITSVAIVTSGYNDNQTPGSLATVDPVLGSLLTQGGAKCSGYQRADAAKLTSGKPAVVDIEGTLITENGTHNYDQHYIAILDGRNGNEVYVSDPSGTTGFGGWTNVQNIMNIVDKGVLYVENE